MGLAAGQARLLTITGRKSDCEFESMRLSHQKLALARDLTDVSNEYQNSLTQTKLVYDYYGTGDTSTQLSYGLLMTPSALNDYMPTLITNAQNRAVLNSKYAAAAAAAGIPQEGLGSLPSDTMRNDFIEALYNQGVIQSELTKDTIQSLPYNQAAGFGGGATVAVTTDEVDLQGLIDKLSEYGGVNATSSIYNSDYVLGLNLYNITDKTYTKTSDSWSASGYTESSSSQVTLADILKGNYVLESYTAINYNSSLGTSGGAIDAIVNSDFWDTMFDSVEDLLDTGDSYTQQALAYARSNIEYLISNQCTEKGAGELKADKSTKSQYYNDEDLANFASKYKKNDRKKGTVDSAARNDADASQNGFIGMCLQFSPGDGKDDDHRFSAVSVNLSSVFKAYLTYFADYMNGLSTVDQNGIQVYDVTDKVSSSHLVDDTTTFTVKVGSEVSSDDLGQATFYDALFNQICANGWVENNNVTDNDYLQQMLQNGMMYVSKVKDDNYYYQGNYSTDTYIKEVTDDSAVAYAESKYNTEKAKINAKEETLDLKIKNLDTEISSLTTEYDTVKNTISKNIEKSFKRYA